jgi:hypothetical protein
MAYCVVLLLVCVCVCVCLFVSVCVCIVPREATAFNCTVELTSVSISDLLFRNIIPHYVIMPNVPTTLLVELVICQVNNK